MDITKKKEESVGPSSEKAESPIRRSTVSHTVGAAGNRTWHRIEFDRFQESDRMASNKYKILRHWDLEREGWKRIEEKVLQGK